MPALSCFGAAALSDHVDDENACANFGVTVPSGARRVVAYDDFLPSAGVRARARGKRLNTNFGLSYQAVQELEEKIKKTSGFKSMMGSLTGGDAGGDGRLALKRTEPADAPRKPIDETVKDPGGGEDLLVKEAMKKEEDVQELSGPEAQKATNLTKEALKDAPTEVVMEKIEQAAAPEGIGENVPPASEVEHGKDTPVSKAEEFVEDELAEQAEDAAEKGMPAPEPDPQAWVSTLWKWTANFNARRARGHARIADNAVLEARKQQVAARYWTQRALQAEAAAMNALPREEPFTGPSSASVKTGEAFGLSKATTVDEQAPLPAGIQSYLVHPDDMARSVGMKVPPGWELPVAPLVGLQDVGAMKIQSGDMTRFTLVVLPWLQREELHRRHGGRCDFL